MTGRSPGFKTADFSYPLITMHDALKQVFHTRQSELWRSTVNVLGVKESISFFILESVLCAGLCG